MKKILFLLSFVALIASCNNSTPQKEIDPDQIVKVNIEVKGMTCSGCENTINTNIKELPGIVSVQSSHIEKQTIVEFDQSQTSIEEIEKAISEKGYKVVDYKTE